MFSQPRCAGRGVASSTNACSRVRVRNTHLSSLYLCALLPSLASAGLGSRAGLLLGRRRIVDAQLASDDPRSLRAGAPSLAISVPFSERFGRRKPRPKKLLAPLTSVRLESKRGDLELPAVLEVAAMAEGILGLAHEPTAEQLDALKLRVRTWFAQHGYPMVGAVTSVDPGGGTLRIRVKAATTAEAPVELIFVDKNGDPTSKPGRTRAPAVSAALGLRSGVPLRLSENRLMRLVGSNGPFHAVGEPAARLTAEGDAQLVLAVCERNFTEVAPTLGLNGREWYASVSARDSNLRGRMQRLSLDFSKYNSSSASISFDDPRLGREFSVGTDVWADNIELPALHRIPGLRSLGGTIPLFADPEEERSARDEPGGAARPERKKRPRERDFPRAGVTLRCEARRESAWRVQMSACAEKVTPRDEGGAIAMGAPGSGDVVSFADGEGGYHGDAPALDLPVTLCVSATSQGSPSVRHRFSLTRTLPLHARCPDYASLDYRVRASLATAFPRITARLRAEVSVASAGQPEYLMRALGGGSTIRGMSYGQLGLARGLATARAELRYQVGGKHPGDSILSLSLFSDGGSGIVLNEDPAEPDESAELGGGGEAGAEKGRRLRPAHGGCVGAGILVGPVRFEYTLASTGERRKTLGLDLD